MERRRNRAIKKRGTRIHTRKNSRHRRQENKNGIERVLTPDRSKLLKMTSPYRLERRIGNEELVYFDSSRIRMTYITYLLSPLREGSLWIRDMR